MEAPNPFTERGIIRDPKLFFGRKHELKQTFERLAAMQSVSIFGERRIGKSSLLVMIAATGPDRLGEGIEFHYIDLERVEGTEDFVVRAIEALHGKGETARDLERAIEERKVVLCLDEFEQTGDFSKDFFGVLRSLASTGHLALVVASQSKLADLASNGVTTSPFFNIFTSLHLAEMSEDEAGDLLNGLGGPAGRKFSPEEVRAAQRETGGSPWKLQLFGYHLFEANDLVEATRRYRHELASYNGAGGIGRPARQRASSTDTRADRAASVLLVLSAVVGLVSMLVSSPPGILITAILATTGLVIMAVDPFRRRTA